MKIEVVEAIFRSLMLDGLFIVGPILIITFIAAVVIGILQSMMQIQEQTLSFAPKLFLVAFILIILTPMIFDRLVTTIREAMEMATELF
jgi:flagellar biosynthetic protein FliQ